MKYLIILTTLTACVPMQPTTPDTACAGAHAWENFHLKHDALSPVIVNKSSYEVPIKAWNDYGTPITLRKFGRGFTIVVEDGGDVSSGFLGLAKVKLDRNGHITQGTVLMNLALLSRYPAEVAAHVMWQELGHLAGLDHQRGADDSAMEDCVGRQDWLGCISNPEALEFNQHDLDQLAAIYAHATGDPVPTGCGSDVEAVIHEFSAEGFGHGH